MTRLLTTTDFYRLVAEVDAAYHPEVIAVLRPDYGKTIPKLVVGRLRGFERALDGHWWLILEDTVDDYPSVSINWDSVLKVVKR